MGGLGPTEDQVFALVAYSVGDAYGALRADLGVAVGSRASAPPASGAWNTAGGLP
jgi:hypothetical protein